MAIDVHKMALANVELCAMSYFDHLDMPIPDSDVARPKVDDAPRFPCQSCAGTGRYCGVRVHQTENKCFACNGRGWFKTSHGDRMKARSERADKAKRQLEAKQTAYCSEHASLIEWAKNNRHWNSFAHNMLGAFDKYGELTDRQTSALYRTMEKSEAKQQARIAERAAKDAAQTTVVDLGSIKAMFDAAKASGLKRLAYRAAGLVISPAAESGANAGSLYVKTRDGDYLGKVTGNRFVARDCATDEHKQALDKIAANPSQAAKDYGKETGECSCCGRELTDPVSIERGIGPICADKWGL